MRLGFSVAAFLEPDVLLVDEVLAVGDANFQQKCLQRIGEIVRQGTTLIYVSHDLASVEASCDRAVWLADAVIQAQGPTKEVVRMYRTAVEQNAMLVTSNEGDLQILKAEVNATDGGQIRSECDVEVCLTINAPGVTGGEFLHRSLAGDCLPHVRRVPPWHPSSRGFPDPLRPQPHSSPERALFDLGGHGGSKVQPIHAVESCGLVRGIRTRSVPSARRGHDPHADLREGRLAGQLNTGSAPCDAGGAIDPPGSARANDPVGIMSESPEAVHSDDGRTESDLGSVTAVILTHMRPTLASDLTRSLIEVEGLAADRIVVVVNGVGGLDDPVLESRVRMLRLPENIGPAGGFKAGMIEAFSDSRNTLGLSL